MKSGVELIAQERQEQIEKHKWTAEHDSSHQDGELAIVAATLAVSHTDARVNDPDNGLGSGDNPWGLELKYFNNPIKSLKVAAALIAAEIDRLIATGEKDGEMIIDITEL